MALASPTDTPADAPPIVQLHGLTVTLGGFEALADLSLELRESAFVAILGPNGGGKTTLLKVLLGLVPPSAGRAELWGAPVGQASAGWIGYVPQLKTLDRDFPALARELVATGLRRRWPGRLSPSEKESVAQALEAAGAAHLADRPIGHLSGGELQRVYLARAMVRRPRLIMLDEPASGMDVTGEADMLKILESYRRHTGATVLMITHDWDAARYHATHVLLLARRAVAWGTVAQALTDAHLRQAFGHVGHYHEGLRNGHGGHHHHHA